MAGEVLTHNRVGVLMVVVNLPMALFFVWDVRLDVVEHFAAVEEYMSSHSVVRSPAHHTRGRGRSGGSRAASLKLKRRKLCVLWDPTHSGGRLGAFPRVQMLRSWIVLVSASSPGSLALAHARAIRAAIMRLRLHVSALSSLVYAAGRAAWPASSTAGLRPRAGPQAGEDATEDAQRHTARRSAIGHASQRGAARHAPQATQGPALRPSTAGVAVPRCRPRQRQCRVADYLSLLPVT